MAKAFSGFNIEDQQLSGIPEDFFRYVLPEIVDVNVLKITLYILWKANKVGDYGISFTSQNLIMDKIFMDSLKQAEDSEQYMHELLNKTAQKGILLCHDNKARQPIYYINCEAGKRESAAALENASNITLDQVKPNIFKIYEENIGPLTPIIADALREAESLYENKWITEAIEIAIKQNARSWRYVEKILERWKKEGRDGTDRKNDQTNYRRYIKG